MYYTENNNYTDGKIAIAIILLDGRIFNKILYFYLHIFFKFHCRISKMNKVIGNFVSQCRLLDSYFSKNIFKSNTNVVRFMYYIFCF